MTQPVGRAPFFPWKHSELVPSDPSSLRGRRLFSWHIWLAPLLPRKAPWLSANRGGAGSDAASSARKLPDWRAKFQRTSSWEERRRKSCSDGEEIKYGVKSKITTLKCGFVRGIRAVDRETRRRFEGVAPMKCWVQLCHCCKWQLWLSFCPTRN